MVQKPIELLKERYKEINDVIEKGPPKSELPDLMRLNKMYLSSIWAIEHSLNKAESSSSYDRKVTGKNHLAEVNELQASSLIEANEKIRILKNKIAIEKNKLYESDRRRKIALSEERGFKKENAELKNLLNTLNVKWK